jgi:hypothetical protein
MSVTRHGVILIVDLGRDTSCGGPPERSKIVIADATRSKRPVSLGRAEAFGWALIAGGLLFALGNLLHPLEHNDAAYGAATWTAAHVAIFFSLPLLLLGLPGLYGALEQRGAGRSALAAVVLAVIGVVGMAPGLLVEAFIAPAVGHEAMQRFEATGFGTVGGLLGLAWVVSSIPLAVACWRAGFGPSWLPVVLVAVALALLASGGAPGPMGGAIIIGATAAYGIAVAVLGNQIRRA